MRFRWNDKLRNRVAIAAGVIFFLGGSVWLSRVARHDVGITEVEIPLETQEFLAELGRRLGDLQFIRRPGSIRDRSPKDDDTLADAQGFFKRESDNFVVYYRRGDRPRAEFILIRAESSQPRMRSVFRHFPLPKDKGGRKLPIYYGTTHQEYELLSGVRGSTLGCVKTELFRDGMLSTMFLSPRMFSMGESIANHTVWHEVAHYVHFDIVNISNVRNLRMWFTEGLAAFVAEEPERMKYVESALRSGRLIPLDRLSAYSDAEAYSSQDVLLFYAEGFSVFQMINDEYGIRAVNSFVSAASTRTTIERAASDVSHRAYLDFCSEWLRYLQRRTAAGHPPPLAPSLFPVIVGGR